MIYRLYVEYTPNTYVMVMQSKELNLVHDKYNRLKEEGHSSMKIIKLKKRKKSGFHKPVVTIRKKLN